jgi:branched-chain amino acid aminotransferase
MARQERIMEIKKSLTFGSRLKETDFSRLVFGETFSDHMFVADYANGRWVSPRIVPFGPMEVSPGNCAMHYGQIIFEGLKAFRAADGGVNLFRPDRHCERLNRSAARLCMPRVPVELFMEGLEGLVKTDNGWVPRERGCSLYVRPFMFASDNFLGVKVSQGYRLMIITCPVGAYYKEGMDPVSLVTSGKYVRAARGGLGEAKTPANYAASLLPAEEAKKEGFSQVLWLDGSARGNIEEVGTMNIMFVIDGEIVTPRLNGSILPGVTRDSVLRLAGDWRIGIRQRRISIRELTDASIEGRLTEAFGTGTAAVISPVGSISHERETYRINGGGIGPLARKFYDEITAIQYGEKPDIYGWCRRIKP